MPQLQLMPAPDTTMIFRLLDTDTDKDRRSRLAASSSSWLLESKYARSSVIISDFGDSFGVLRGRDNVEGGAFVRPLARPAPGPGGIRSSNMSIHLR